MSDRLFITGCSGYIAKFLIEKCIKDPYFEWIGGNDIRETKVNKRFNFYKVDIRDPSILDILKKNNVNVLVHLAWIFNPTHNKKLEYEVDVKGSENILKASKIAKIKYILYLSSTTAYGAYKENPPEIDEEYFTKGNPKFLYSKYKAIVDKLFINFMKENPEIKVCVYRAPIVIGPNIKNYLLDIVSMKFMFGVLGYDPQMQFLHEEDLKELLFWSLKNKPTGIYNVASNGLIKYSEISKIFKKRLIKFPYRLLYSFLWLGWQFRILRFPPSILDFIRYPWIASRKKFNKDYPEFEFKFTSKKAIEDLAKHLKRK